MLFDLRARGRRRTVQVIYAVLAILMGGGLVFFGVGGAGGGGVADIFTDNNGGGGGGTSSYAKRVETLQARVRTMPRSEKLWAELAQARYQDAATDRDQATGAFDEDGLAKLRAATRAWERYLALDPKTPDDQVANVMVQAYSALGQYAKGANAMEIVVEARPPSSALYYSLAQLAYLAGQERKGDLAAARAVELAPKAQQATLEADLKSMKDQAEAAQAGSASTTATP